MIANNIPRVPYAGNGVTTAFAYPNFFVAQTDLLVYTMDTFGVIVGPYNLGGDYTITGTPAANGTYPNGGTINMVIPPATGLTLTVLRISDFLQATHWVDGDPDPAAVKELAFDKLTLEVQRALDLLSRAVTMKDGFANNNHFDPTLPSVLTPFATLGVNGLGSGWQLALPNAATTNPYAPSAGLSFLGQLAILGWTVQNALDALNPGLTGSRAVPLAVAAITAIAPTPGIIEQTFFIKGNLAPITVTANPQIQSPAGMAIGQRLRIIGNDDVNWVLYSNGNGLKLKGNCKLGNDSNLRLFWDGANWLEDGRSNDIP